MKTSYLLIIITLSITSFNVNSQVYPSYGPEIDVTINGLTFDAMEPFLSSDGNFLFFNNLNDGVDTRLYYSTKVNDSTFNFIGELIGTNQPTPPHLDAVADMDNLNNFYWTSTRDYPAELENLFHGTFNNGSVTNIGRVHGDFNKNTNGWLIMDHGISYDGQFLYFNNARFDGVCQGPCETELGIAQKINDSTFTTLVNSDTILQNVTDTLFNFYAPCISSDNLELYYTRFLKGPVTASTMFDICVAVRDTPADTFSLPLVLFSEPIAELIEAPTLTTNMLIVYYHRKTPTSHKIVMRYRNQLLGNTPLAFVSKPVYPNPASNKITLEINQPSKGLHFMIYNAMGEVVMKEQEITSNTQEINIEKLDQGAYFINLVKGKNVLETIKFIVN